MKQAPKQKRKDDFTIGRVLGQGAFGQVIEVEDKETRKRYAMKILSKAHILKEKKMDYVKIERDVMKTLNHPNIVRLLLTFQDPGNLYYVVELAPNGDLQHILDNIYSIDIPEARIILGQTLLAIAHIHKHKIIHRDLKPENLLLDSKNRIKVTDFGTAKMFTESQEFMLERGSFVGTADYVCPETLDEKPVGPASDLWSYGCLIYHLIVGRAPFHTNSSYATFQKILNCEYEIPGFVPEDAKDLIKRILVTESSDRLGYNDFDTDYQSIRSHPFFNGIDWETLPMAEVQGFKPFIPSVPLHKRYVEPSDNIKEFLKPGERVIMMGDVEKRVFLSFKQRYFVLTDSPRLFYISKKKGVLKGEIPLSKEIVVTAQSKAKWTIETLGRVYNLTSMDETAEEWKGVLDSLKEEL